MQLEVASVVLGYNCASRGMKAATISDYFLDVKMTTKFGDVFKIISFLDEELIDG